MNSLEAKAVLARALRFGDTTQISAANYIAELESTRNLVKSVGGRVCPGCDGTGVVPECGGPDVHEDDCDCYRVLIRCEICDEFGLVDSDSDVITQLEDVDTEVIAEIVKELKPGGAQ